MKRFFKKYRVVLSIVLVILLVGLAPVMILEFGGESAKEKIGPEITGITEWINTDQPVLLSHERGKVIIVDFWTYSCINCLRTIPYLNRWYQTYREKGLLIVGVHSPEFGFEHELPRVQEAVKALKITYPVALDNQNKTWNAFGNQYWPHKYFFGSDGTMRYEVVGEGRYEETEEKIRELLSEKGEHLDAPLTSTGIGEQVDFQKIKTPEIFFGTFHGGFIGNPHGILADANKEFIIPPQLIDNVFYLAGHWNIGEELARHVEAGTGQILIRYEAKSVNWVAGSNRSGAWAEILLDGQPIQRRQAGSDIVFDSTGNGRLFIKEKRLYRIIRNEEGYGKHLLSIIVHQPDIESYSFTFG